MLCSVYMVVLPLCVLLTIGMKQSMLTTRWRLRVKRQRRTSVGLIGDRPAIRPQGSGGSAANMSPGRGEVERGKSTHTIDGNRDAVGLLPKAMHQHMTALPCLRRTSKPWSRKWLAYVTTHGSRDLPGGTRTSPRQFFTVV